MEDDTDTRTEGHTDEPIASDKTLRDTFRSGSADEVRDRVKDTVAKGVAAVAGALRGFTETTRREDVAAQAKEAISTAGETASRTMSGVADQARQLKEPLQEAGQKLTEAARDLKSTAQSQVHETKSALRGGGAGSTSPGSQTPDISRTPMAASDEELKEKDLSKDLQD